MSVLKDVVPSPHGIYPLTLFDHQYAVSSFVTGWLLEGDIDTGAFISALDRLVDKWRLLSGRLEPVKGNDKVKWQIRIPLGPLPKEYLAYNLTRTTSQLPLSHYVSLPLPAVSPSLPRSFFFNETTPLNNASWASAKHPLTCWHVTHFPAESGQPTYSCIGFTCGHGIFDASGSAFIMHALEAEMHGREWEVPLMPHEGLNVNQLQQALDTGAQAEAEKLDKYPCLSLFSVWTAIKFAAWHIWQSWWHKAHGQIVILPKEAYTSLVDGVRADLAREGKDDIRVSTGDVLIAWIFKTVYSDDPSPNKMVHCSNSAAFRYQFSSPFNLLEKYPHNTIVALPYPLISVSSLQSTPLSTLAYNLATSRLSFSTSHTLSVYKSLQSTYKTRGIIGAFPFHPDAHESLIMTNISATRLMEADWSALGAHKIISSYRYPVADAGMTVTNTYGIAGRLADGSTVLDMVLSKSRWAAMEEEVNMLVAASMP